MVKDKMPVWPIIIVAFGILWFVTTGFKEPMVIIYSLIAAACSYIIQKIRAGSKSIEKQIDDTTVILLYILSFFIPLAGFIVGAIYASKEEEHYKHVGKNCLIFSVLNLVLGFIVIVAIIAG